MEISEEGLEYRDALDAARQLVAVHELAPPQGFGDDDDDDGGDGTLPSLPSAMFGGGDDDDDDGAFRWLIG